MGKKILIIGNMDGFANAVRPSKIKEFLEQNGYEVILKNTFDKPSQNTKRKIKDLIKVIIPKHFKNKIFIKNIKKRAELLSDEIKEIKPDAIICESEQDSYVLTKNLGCLKIYDAASPWVDEYYYSGKLTKSNFEELRKMELDIYEKSDYVTFHWDNYTRYVKKNVYNGKNLFVMNWGCTPKDQQAKYAQKPKIIFMGYLKGYWNNIPLLSRLAQKYDIDVYGGPKPPKKYGLNYKGYAPSTDILAEYQFGLITITDDPLRRSSFSSKHLEYMNYGLPVLTPDWRKDHSLDEFSIYYNEDNFEKKIAEYSEKALWEKMSKKCFEQAKKWSWNNQLQALIPILKKELR